MISDGHENDSFGKFHVSHSLKSKASTNYLRTLFHLPERNFLTKAVKL